MKIVKGILIVIAVLVALFIGMMLMMKWVIDANTTVHKSKEVIIGSGGKKALVIYQPSRSSLTKDMAEAIEETLNKSGYQVTMNYPSDQLTYNPADYEVIVFGSPVYAGMTSAVLENYMKSIKDYSGKKVLIFATGGNKDGSKELANLEAMVNGADKMVKIKLLNKQTDAAVNSVNELIKE